MKKVFSLLLVCLLLLGGCTTPQNQEDHTIEILATTYPLYLFASTITNGADHINVSQLITEQVSCLHDYTLSVKDMKLIEKADAIVINGAELEEFMEDALAQSGAAVIDCSESIELLPAAGHDHEHDHDDHHHGHYDPHYWLEFSNAAIMLKTITDQLSTLDSSHAERYKENYTRAVSLLAETSVETPALSCPYLITFHDGFQYLAHAGGLTLLKSIEEESGSEASAAEIKKIISLVQEYQIPAIFTEKNGSDRTANVISRETGVAVYQLDMLMSGDGHDLSDYINAMQSNYSVILEALS